MVYCHKKNFAFIKFMYTSLQTITKDMDEIWLLQKTWMIWVRYGKLFEKSLVIWMRYGKLLQKIWMI